MTSAERDVPDLPGDDVHRDGFWAGFRLGLERGSQTGYERGYADADHTLQDAITCFLQANPSREVIRQMDARTARDAAGNRPLDQRTGTELIHDAHLSWGLEPPAPTTADHTAATRADEDAWEA